MPLSYHKNRSSVKPNLLILLFSGVKNAVPAGGDGAALQNRPDRSVMTMPLAALAAKRKPVIQRFSRVLRFVR
mgnify:CR=1 FL=1